VVEHGLLEALVAILKLLTELENFTLLVPQLPEVVVSSHGSNLQHFLELWEAVEDLGEVPVLKTENLDFILRIFFHWDVPVLISNLKDKTDVSEVASHFERHKMVGGVPPEHLHLALVKEENAAADCVLSYHTDVFQVFIDLLVREGGRNVSDKFVICLESKLLVFKKNCKLGLEGLQKIVFNNLHFHVFRDILIKLIFGQESVWTVLEVPESVLPPLVDDFSWDFLVRGQLSSNLDN
jgi:hypothetical protein